MNTGNLPDSEEQTILVEMREIAQTILIALGLEITGESEDGSIQANIVLSAVGD